MEHLTVELVLSILLAFFVGCVLWLPAAAGRVGPRLRGVGRGRGRTRRPGGR